jgi:predicted DNA-binding WGR domain protein
MIAAVSLYRTDPARNMRRFYHLDIQPDLFGQWCVVREWGRIGCAGRMQLEPYPTPDAAQAALDRQRRAKQRRGYAGTD